MFSVALAAKVVYVRDVGRGNLGLRPTNPEAGGPPVLVFLDVNGWHAYEEGQYPKWPNQAQLSGFWKTIAAHNTEMKNELKGLVEQYHTSQRRSVSELCRLHRRPRAGEYIHTVDDIHLVLPIPRNFPLFPIVYRVRNKLMQDVDHQQQCHAGLSVSVEIRL